MKKITAIILAFLLIAGTLTGCSKTSSDKKISVICTIFPQYDWVRQILGDNADNFDLTFLLDNRIDLHNYQPSVADFAKISTCDLFIYVGGVSDAWADDALNDVKNKDMVTLNLLEILGDTAKIEEAVEGMEDEDEEDEEEYDEHVWLSLKNAQFFCAAIAGILSDLDPQNADKYSNNLTAYNGKLAALDAQYRATVDAASYKTLLFADRFPFRYLADDYGLDYYAAFAGCSAETEASFATVVFLAKKMDELQLPCVMVTESSDQSIARTVIQNTAAQNYKICILDAIQSVSAESVRNGVTYLSIMEKNLESLKTCM